MEKSLIATSLGVLALLVHSAPAVAAPLKPYVLSCDVEETGDIEVIGSGLGKKPLNASYKTKYRIDPATKSITSLLSYSSKRGNYDNNIFITDVRVLSPDQIVFCLDAENKCEYYDKPVKGGTSVGTVKGQISLHVLDLKSGKISYSERMVIQATSQTGVINKETAGRCAILPA